MELLRWFSARGGSPLEKLQCCSNISKSVLPTAFAAVIEAVITSHRSLANASGSWPPYPVALTAVYCTDDAIDNLLQDQSVFSHVLFLLRQLQHSSLSTSGRSVAIDRASNDQRISFVCFRSAFSFSTRRPSHCSAPASNPETLSKRRTLYPYCPV